MFELLFLLRPALSCHVARLPADREVRGRMRRWRMTPSWAWATDSATIRRIAIRVLPPAELARPWRSRADGPSSPFSLAVSSSALMTAPTLVNAASIARIAARRVRSSNIPVSGARIAWCSRSVNLGARDRQFGLSDWPGLEGLSRPSHPSLLLPLARSRRSTPHLEQAYGVPLGQSKPYASGDRCRHPDDVQPRLRNNGQAFWQCRPRQHPARLLSFVARLPKNRRGVAPSDISEAIHDIDSIASEEAR